MQQLAIAFDNPIIEKSSQPKTSNVHIETHDDLYYVYRGTLRITKGSRHKGIIERELALHIQTKHRLVVYVDGAVEAQWSSAVLSGGRWIGCMSDVNYPYDAIWKSSHALHHAKQYFAKYCIEDYEIVDESKLVLYNKEVLEA